jgi:hypothetical protein
MPRAGVAGVEGQAPARNERAAQVGQRRPPRAVVDEELRDVARHERHVERRVGQHLRRALDPRDAVGAALRARDVQGRASGVDAGDAVPRVGQRERKAARAAA